MDWYYASNGQQQGPVSQEQLIELYNSGQVKGTDLVWNDTMTDWVAYQSVPELGGAPAASSPVAPVDTPTSTTAAAAAAPLATAPQPAASGEKVPNYLWQSIVCLILCCLPLAIPALIFATKVNPALEAGDIAAAKDASAKAKMWCWISFGVGLVVQLLYIGLVVIGGVMEASNY
ncbi:MAG: hypothetical protein CMO55_24815 [Verrucomicrobiales bacterium]|nr:hypothetical protein [Verrucomicrobiales bacterium]